MSQPLRHSMWEVGLDFGLGTAASVERVVIRWPSGKTQELKAPQVGRIHRIQEPA